MKCLDTSFNHRGLLTEDAIFNGQVRIVQPRDGYRFSLDALLLAAFTAVAPEIRVADLGAGAGAASLALAWRMKSGTVLAVEVQPRLAECARLNAASFAGPARIEVFEMNWSDLRPEHLGGSVEAVVCNPPYRKMGTGRLNPVEEEAAARHEIYGGAESAARAAARILIFRGRLNLVYPAARMAGLFKILAETGFEPKRLRMVHSRPEQRAELVLVEARLGGREELLVEPPLYIYGAAGEYTGEVEAILNGESFAGLAEPPGVGEDRGR